MLDEETEKRQLKMKRLRAARLEREANTPAEPPKAAKSRKKAPAKTTAKT